MKQFDKYASEYNAIRGKIAYPEALYDFLAERVPDRKAALDLGCGNGVSTIRLAPFFGYVEGVDHGGNLIEKARENYPELVFSVCEAERYNSERQFDLVTSATSFYWMDRDKVLTHVKELLVSSGLFCAYKYDVPAAYGPLRIFIEHEMANRWGQFRDPRLVGYDDTLERIVAAGGFADIERRVFANIIALTPLELGLFLLSTSYVTAYMEHEGGSDYAKFLLSRVQELGGQEAVKINFDIHAYLARRE